MGARLPHAQRQSSILPASRPKGGDRSATPPRAGTTAPRGSNGADGLRVLFTADHAVAVSQMLNSEISILPWTRSRMLWCRLPLPNRPKRATFGAKRGWEVGFSRPGAEYVSRTVDPAAASGSCARPAGSGGRLLVRTGGRRLKTAQTRRTACARSRTG